MTPSLRDCQNILQADKAVIVFRGNDGYEGNVGIGIIPSSAGKTKRVL
jgi:hypothetical protein